MNIRFMFPANVTPFPMFPYSAVSEHGLFQPDARAGADRACGHADIFI